MIIRRGLNAGGARTTVKFSPTDDQLRAIEADPGAILVIAGPGAGKTYCLIGRIRHLLVRFDYPPERILAVTFTNKAAAEIAHRLSGEVGGLGGHVPRGTLHALCLRLLREFPEEAGLRPGFGVADEEYQLALLRRLRIPEKRAKQLVTIFGRARSRGGTLDEREERIHETYRDVLRRKNLLDFDDLILHTHELLRTRPDLLALIAGRWDAILVDEFQDLTPTQYAILTALVGRHRHVFAVGDDEQSIYGFAGADPHILDRFRRDFGIEPIVLETNHRNSRVIFDTARLLLRANPSLFEKRLTASRVSRFPVRAVRFRTEEEEFRWLVSDLLADRAAADGRLAWGDYAVLVRRHEVGERLEASLLRAGAPVLTARGRAIADDPIAAPVFAGFHAIRDPKDRVPWEILTNRFLPRELREILRAKYPVTPLPAALRLYGWDPTTPEAEGKPVRRLYHYLTNAPLIARAARNLGELVDTLLEQRPSERRTRLEEEAEGLTDPEALPAVRELSERLERPRNEEGEGEGEGEHRIHLVPASGLEIALAGMLRAAGLGNRVASQDARVESGDLTLDLPRMPGAGFRLFKALQRLAAAGRGLRLDDCVTFDLETTGIDIDHCGIVEIGAARVRGGAVVETFRTLVNPGMPIPTAASGVHGYTDADVADAPRFATAWARFRSFAGDDLLVAHNARQFDLPVLARHLAAIGAETRVLPCLDTFPLALSVSRASARLTSLAERYGVPLAEAHHALDDALALAGVLRGLLADRAAYHRKTSFTAGLEWLGLALALERGERSPEERLLTEIATMYTLGPYSDCLEQYEAARTAGGLDGPPVAEVIDRLGGRALMNRIRARRTVADRYPSSVARLRRLLEGLEHLPVEQGIREVLDVVALARLDGSQSQASAVSLLTLHATKGLEFSRVYIVGVEDYEIPGFHAMQGQSDDEFPESRRLLYVGMTRARDRLILTSAVERAGKGSGGTMLLEEMGLAMEEGVVPVALTIVE